MSESPDLRPLPHAYLTPGRSRLAAFSAWALLAGFLGVTAAFLLGYQRVASPGPLARGHESVNAQCAACHEPWTGVVALRCESCHDTRSRGLFTHARHEQTARPRAASAQPPPGARSGSPGCEACHTEHRGADAVLVSASEATCRACHAFAWSDHPEFAAFDAPAVEAAGGIRFSHTVHIPEARKTLGKGCEGCHERRPDAPQFDPIGFDRHCAACHMKNGALDQIRQKTDRPHRDPATIARAAALARLVDPGALQRARTDIEGRIGETERLLAGVGPGAAGSDRLERLAAIADDWSARGIAAVVPEPSPADRADRERLESRLAGLRERLDRLDAPAAPLEPPPSIDAARAQLAAVLAPCVACHETDGVLLRPMTGARPVLTAAAFTHAPHATRQTLACESCHETTDRSGQAADVNLPRVGRCQSCHGAGAAAAPVSCDACHRYHRRPGATPAAWTAAASF